MSCPETTSPHSPAPRLHRLIPGFARILALIPAFRPAGTADGRPARLDLARLSDHDLRDLGLPPREPLRLERGLWL